MYKEYLAEFWYSAKALENSKVSFSVPTGGIYGEVGVNTFRNAIGSHYIPHSSEYVAPPSIDIVRPWFETIRKATEMLSQWYLKLPGPLLMLRGYPKAQSLELNLDTKSIQLLQNNHLCPAKRQQKVPTNFKTGRSKKRKESSSAMDSNPSQPPVSTPVDTGMHKEDQQATCGPTSLGVTSEARANPQLSSGTDPHVLEDQTKYVSEGLETILTQPITGKGASSIARQIKEETSNSIKLEDLIKLVSHVQPSFKELDSPKDDPIIVVDDSDEDKDDKVHATENVETKDTSITKSSSLMSSQIQELTNQVLIL
nr:hypothetical protein [Tanacetum cinerariifolium]